jgi:leucyl-tRNA synthetase
MPHGLLSPSKVDTHFRNEHSSPNCPSAGDGAEDSNFEESVANSAILKLYELRKWCEEVTTGAIELKDGEDFEEVKKTKGIKSADVIQRTGATHLFDELFLSKSCMECLVFCA